jgi:AcrR family transcriptional regulator
VNSPGGAPPAGVRERILVAALRCFLDRGYEQTTIAQIRIDSGVSNGALFHHFPTKEAIADALYVEGIASFQEGVREIVRQPPPRSLLAAVLAVIGHQLAWTEQHTDLARFIYQRGHPDFDSLGGAAVGALNRSLAAEVRQWMAPLAERGLIRPIPMLVVTAIVNGPAHAVARRWLAGQVHEPLTSYADVLARAASAALSANGAAGADEAAGDGASAPASRPEPGSPLAGAGRITVELLDADGLVTGRGEATIRLAAT